MLTNVDFTSGKMLLRNARTLDVAGGKLLDATNVLIDGGKVVDIDAASAPPADADVFDLGGLTLSPGLIDTHVHILSPYLTEQKGVPGMWTFKQMDRNCENTLAAGVVCVVDMLSPIKVLRRQRKKIAAGKVNGPDVMMSGGIFSCQGGYPEAINPVPKAVGALVGQPKYQPQSPDEAAKLVNYLHSLGATVIKVGYTRLSRQLVDGRSLPAISDEVLAGVCDAAHALGLKVRVHHNWSEDMLHLVDFKIDALEHGVYDRNLLDDEIMALKNHGASVIPTLTINDSQGRFEEKLGFLRSERAKEYFEPQALEHLLWVCSTWTKFQGESYDGSFGYTRANRYCYEIEYRNTRKLFEAGVKLYAGTDCGAVVAYPGELADEILRLTSIGMTNAQAIRAATNEAADFIGRPDLGEVVPGKTAHLAVFEGNPLEDLSALRRVRYVLKSGRLMKTSHDELPEFWQGFTVLAPN